jgi:hypothetical protein
MYVHTPHSISQGTDHRDKTGARLGSLEMERQQTNTLEVGF